MMAEILKGNKVTLRPATLNDRKQVYQWLAHSDLTKEMMGPPVFTDHKIPDWNEFLKDYETHYFDGTQPEKGQSFIIEINGKAIGHINHNKINYSSRTTDLDIWLCDRKYTGKGYGTEAIELLCDYLQRRFGCRRIFISPSKRNVRAIRSYQKAGFVSTNKQPAKNEMDYVDNVIMEKILVEPEQ